jgi:hypothetical protein
MYVWKVSVQSVGAAPKGENSTRHSTVSTPPHAFLNPDCVTCISPAHAERVTVVIYFQNTWPGGARMSDFGWVRGVTVWRTLLRCTCAHVCVRDLGSIQTHRLTLQPKGGGRCGGEMTVAWTSAMIKIWNTAVKQIFNSFWWPPQNVAKVTRHKWHKAMLTMKNFNQILPFLIST